MSEMEKDSPIRGMQGRARQDRLYMTTLGIKTLSFLSSASASMVAIFLVESPLTMLLANVWCE